MSYTAIHIVRNPEDGFESEAEFKNGWGSAPFVWDRLVRKYQEGVLNGEPLCGDGGDFSRGVGPFKAWELLWEYHQDGRHLEPWEANVLLSTYDNVILHREQFELMAESMERFAAEHPPGNRVCSLKDQAEVLRRLATDETVTCCGWEQTSVSGFWGESRYNEETESYDPYRIDTGDQHRTVELRPLG